jgi:hypothetical protein
LCLAQSILDAGLVCRHPLGHPPRVARPIKWLGRQAVPAQAQKVRVGATTIQASQRRSHFAEGRQFVHFGEVVARVGWLAGQNHTQDAAQAKNVGPFVDPLDLAAGLLRRHECGRPDRLTRPRFRAIDRIFTEGLGSANGDGVAVARHHGIR